jgi:hypothetical protein
MVAALAESSRKIVMRRVHPPRTARFAGWLLIAVAPCMASGCVSVVSSSQPNAAWISCQPIHEATGDCVGCNDIPCQHEPNGLESSSLALHRCGAGHPLKQKIGQHLSLCSGVVKGWWFCCQEKIARHFEEANAPPWPKFHPVPTQPAFTRRDVELQPMPETWGRFVPSH